MNAYSLRETDTCSMPSKCGVKWFDVPVTDFFYFLGFTALCLWQGFGTTNFQEVFFVNISTLKTLFKLICFCCLIVRVITKPPDAKHGLVALAIGAVLLISYLQCKSSTLLITFAFIALGRDVRIKDLAKIIFAVYLFIFVLTVLSAQIGFIEVQTLMRADDDVRSSMGFSHPNRFSSTIFQILAAWLVIRYPKFSIIDFLFSILSILIILLVADSRTTSLALIFMVILVLTARHAQKRGKYKPFAVVASSIVIGLIAVSLYFMLFYDKTNHFHVLLDNTLSKRLSLAHGYYSTFSPTLFGHPFSSDVTYSLNIGGSHIGLLVDNTYVKLLLLYGFVPFCLFLVGLVMLLKRATADECINREFPFLITFLIIGFCESFVLNISMNFTLIVFSMLFCGKGNCGSANHLC